MGAERPPDQATMFEQEPGLQSLLGTEVAQRHRFMSRDDPDRLGETSSFWLLLAMPLLLNSCFAFMSRLDLEWPPSLGVSITRSVKIKTRLVLSL